MQITPGTRAFITGASRGSARRWPRRSPPAAPSSGWRARSADELDALAARLPGTHHVLPCDVGDERSVHDALERFVAQAGGLDLLVANAGIPTTGRSATSR